jgi:hypothetical protein
MNPMFNYWAVVERMQSLQAEADTAARARRLRRSRRGLAFAAAGRGRRRGTTARRIVIKAGEAL